MTSATQPAPASIARTGAQRAVFSPRVLFINHRSRNCGVYQFGCLVVQSIAPSSAIDCHYREVDDEADFLLALDEVEPQVVIANYHPATMAWLTRAVVRRTVVPIAGIVHEFDHGNCFLAESDRFTYRILPDPTVVSRLPNVFSSPRVAPHFLLDYALSPSLAPPVTIGSFGFASGGKGFEHIVRLVQDEFDEACIRFHIPSSEFADPDGARARETVEHCRALIRKPGISLLATHDFMDERALLGFLSTNSINVFLYEDQLGRGVSSVVDLAVAAGRPIAVSESRMFRALHAVAPASRIVDSSLRQILHAGPVEILAAKAAWSPVVLRGCYEEIVRQILRLDATASAVQWNGVLNDEERRRYDAVIAELRRLAPETMARKIERANVQQAFVKEAVQTLGRDNWQNGILCVGSFEDTAYEALRALGYPVEGIDPALNCDLDTFFRSPSRPYRRYGVIFSTSVIEHVADDELFLEQVRDLLAPGGVAILTLDFRDDWRIGDPKPVVDHRLYTNEDLLGRLLLLLHHCELVDPPRWIDAAPDFDYEGARYAFATLVFRKRHVSDLAEAAFVQGLERARYRSLREKVVLKESIIAALLYSRSWRITAPLRVIASWLGGNR